MKTINEILSEAARAIAQIHNRTSMFVGSTSQPGAAHTLDGMLWIAHWFWATVKDRQVAFRDIHDRVRARHHCGSYGFADTFRQHEPDSDEESACRYILSCWAEIASELGIDISADAEQP